MPKTCPTCNGSRRVQRVTSRAWWQVLLLRPAIADELCVDCAGTGVVKGSPEEEQELEQRRQHHREELGQRRRHNVAAERSIRLHEEKVQRERLLADWLASPPPKGITSKVVDAWMRAHVGVLVEIIFDAKVEGYTYEDRRDWTVAPPLTLDPLVWQLPVVNSFPRLCRSPEKLGLALLEDVGLVYQWEGTVRPNPAPAHHEADVSADHMLYKVGFSERTYSGLPWSSSNDPDGYDRWVAPTTDPRIVTYWQTYKFSVPRQRGSGSKRATYQQGA
jgi:hypothetical protein